MSKTKISVFLRRHPPFGLFFHLSTSTFALIEDLESSQTFSTLLIGDTEDCCTCSPPIVLWSDLPYDEDFLNSVTKKHFDMATYNCSNRVNDVLDHYFPDESCLNRTCFLYQLFCCLPCVMTLGCFRCLPQPPGLMTPTNVNQKAQWLAQYYGEASSLLTYVEKNEVKI